MEQKNQPLHLSGFRAVGVLILAAVCSVLASPKSGIGFFAWLAPLGFLYFLRLGKLRAKMAWLAGALLITSVLNAYDVAPFPLPVLVVLSLLEAIKMMVIYLLDLGISRKFNHFSGTLFFPAAMVTMEYLSARTGGVWWSAANSQLSFSWLSQLASVTGIWGISFLIYWFASVIVWYVKNYRAGNPVAGGLKIYGVVFGMVMVFGALRYNSHADTHPVKVAGLSVPSFAFLENVYKDYCGKQVRIDPRTSVSSAALREIGKAEIPLIETADTVAFRSTYATMRQINDSLFRLSQIAADKGAKIIVWSEANAIAFPFDQDSLKMRASRFALQNGVYLQMALAVIHQGKITPGKKFLENEALLFGPDGRLLNTFHKNNPVPFAEASVPGDGIIPVTETPYGRISTSICYDADFPIQMQQLAKNKSDILLLPSGDWYAISPYHTYMAIFRAIENGNSIVRQVSGGLSVAADYRGKIHASLDFYGRGDKIWIADFPVGHVPTLYARIGDAFAYVCILLTALGIVFIVWKRIFAGKGRKQSRVPGIQAA